MPRASARRWKPSGGPRGRSRSGSTSIGRTTSRVPWCRPPWGIGGNPAFPNVRGEDFQGLARARLAEVPSLAVLNAVRTPAPLGQVADTRAAYIVAGSFVGFLIEQYGLPTFRRLYDTGHCEEAYGKSLQRLEEEWRAHVQGP
jgi:hypothetical protein